MSFFSAYFHLELEKRFLLLFVYSVANNGRSSAIADCLRHCSAKKTLKNDRPLFTHKKKDFKKDFKTVKPERSFFF